MIKGQIEKKFEGLKIGVHYGCHILRPRELVQFINPGTASIFDQLVEITGAETVPWGTQGECCGSPMLGVDNELSTDLTKKKIKDALKSGAQYLTMACPYCELQFDRVQRMLISKGNGNPLLPSILYTQLLGLALGIDATVLGIYQNEVDISGILKFLL
jgi:heterodisulfide reductase subunit B